MSGYTKSGYILLSCTRISFSLYLISGNMICIINKLYPSSTSYSNNTSCSFCLFLHIFLPSLCSPFLNFSFPIYLICFVLYPYISYLSTMFYRFSLFLFLYNFNVVNYQHLSNNYISAIFADFALYNLLSRYIISYYTDVTQPIMQSYILLLSWYICYI